MFGKGLENYLRKTLKDLEMSLIFTIYRRIITVFKNLNQYKIVMPLFGAPQFYTNFLKLISLVIHSSISRVELKLENQYFSKFSVVYEP